MDLITAALIAAAFFCWGAYCGAWQMRRLWRRHYRRLVREMQAGQQPPADPPTPTR